MDERSVLTDCVLFEGIAADEIAHVLDCLQARRASYPRHTAIYNAGDTPTGLGVVLAGAVDIIREDWWGNRVLLARIGPAGIFAESVAMAEGERLQVSVIAAEDCRVLFLNGRSILTGCPSACSFHTQLIYNAARLLAQKNIDLTRTLEHLSRRTIREKLLSYLNSEAQRQGSQCFTLTLNRQELADTLCVDRSAMCAVLSTLKQEGVLDYNRGYITLYGACPVPQPPVTQPSTAPPH